MSDKYDEQILTVPQALIMSLLEEPTSTSLDNAAYAVIQTPGFSMIVRRGDVEDEESHLQAVSYAALVNNKREVLVYKRGKAGGEQRLHDQYSIGVGGHVNADDCFCAVQLSSLEDRPISPIVLSTLRELAEELTLTESVKSNLMTTAGPVIYDDSNPVSRVHLGFSMIVHVADGAEIKANENCLEELQWVPLEELLTEKWQDRLETWSQILVTKLGAMDLNNDAEESTVIESSEQDLEDEA